LIALPDVNVLLALAWNNPPHHDAAHCWFARNAAAGWAACLSTQMGFLRLSLNPQVVGVLIECQAALHLLQSLVTHPHHRYLATAPALTSVRLVTMILTFLGPWLRRFLDNMIVTSPANAALHGG
jgi:toxin-antitoxin system PIN domain toxin